MENTVVLKGGESSSPHGLVVVEGSIFFSDTMARKIKVLHRHTDPGEAEVNVFAGNDVAQRKYGLANVASFGQPSSIVAEGNSVFVCDTGANAISLITSIKALHSATKQFGQLYDAFGVHCDEKNVEAASVLPFVDNAVQFYRKCVHDIREFFELPHDKCFDGSFGAPSKETIDSLEMIGEGLPGVLGTREHSQNIEGNKGTLANFWEQGNKIRKITVRKHSDIINREHYLGVSIYGHLCTTVVPMLV